MKKEDAKVFMEQIKDDIAALTQLKSFNCNAVWCSVCPFDIEDGGCISGEANTRLQDIEEELEQLKAIRRAFREGETYANN